jgi:hypothetical protein
MECRPHCLQLLAEFERERIDQTLRKLELALAADDIGRAQRILSEFEMENREQRRPLEAIGLAPQVVRQLNRSGIETVAQLREVSTETLLGLQQASDSTIRQLFKLRDYLERNR